jgi:hypothetical protein
MAHEIEYGLMELLDTPSFRGQMDREFARELGSMIDRQIEDIHNDMVVLQENIYAMYEDLKELVRKVGTERVGAMEVAVIEAYFQEHMESLYALLELYICMFDRLKLVVDEIERNIAQDPKVKQRLRWHIVEIKDLMYNAMCELRMMEDLYQELVPFSKELKDVACYKEAEQRYMSAWQRRVEAEKRRREIEKIKEKL